MKNRHSDTIETTRPGKMTPNAKIDGAMVMEALASAQSADGSVQDIKGTPTGTLRIHTTHGVINCTVDQFSEAYKGMVRMWPTIGGIRAKQDSQRQVQAARDREAAKAAKIQAAKLAKAERAKTAKAKSAKK